MSLDEAAFLEAHGYPPGEWEGERAERYRQLANAADQELCTMRADATAYEFLRDRIDALIPEGEFDGDEAEDELLARFVESLAAELARVKEALADVQPIIKEWERKFPRGGETMRVVEAFRKATGDAPV